MKADPDPEVPESYLREEDMDALEACGTLEDFDLYAL